MSLWFLDDSKRPITTDTAEAGPAAPPPHPHSSRNQQQGIPHGQGHSEGSLAGDAHLHREGFHQNTQPRLGEAAEYFEPPAGPPPAIYDEDDLPPSYESHFPAVASGSRHAPFENHVHSSAQVVHDRSSSKNPMDPIPDVFSRPPPSQYAYIKFTPMSLVADTERLQDGFALIPPATRPGEQHPFASHDVTEEDWHKFLSDLERTAHLPPDQRFPNNGLIAGKRNAEAVQRRLKRDKIEPVGDFLMAWNQCFFHPRRISVILALGQKRYSGGIEGIPPDLASLQRRVSSSSQSRSHRSSDDDESDRSSPGLGLGFISQRRERKCARRKARREMIGRLFSSEAEGSERHHPEVHAPETKYRLVLCYWDGSREVY